jgi:hypothetical protein
MRVDQFYYEFISRMVCGATMSTKRCGNWWWRDDTLYYDRKPRVRALWGANQRLVLFGSPEWMLDAKINVGTHGKREWVYPFEDFQRSCISVRAPTTGHFSRYPGDELSVPATHQRNQWLYIQKAIWFADVDLPRLSAEDLAKADIVRKTGKGWTRSSWFIKDFDAIYENYQTYSDAFGLGWQPIPQTIESRVYALMEEKVGKGMEIHAKKVALKAMGITTKKKAG